MSQLFGECDFGIARETRRRFHARILVVQFNLGHDAFLSAYRMPAIEMPCQNRHGAGDWRIKRSPTHAQCKHSQHRDKEGGLSRFACATVALGRFRSINGNYDLKLLSFWKPSRPSAAAD